MRYSDGTILPNAAVAIGSTIYGELHRGTTDAAGRYLIGDLPVGPLTFSVSDASGNVTFAANQIRTPGELVTQDLVIQKRELAGTGTVRIVVKRSDRDPADPAALVAGAHAGVYAQGYGLTDGYTDSNGRIEFTRIPAGFISILASEFGLTRESAGIDLDLHPDTVIEQTLILHVPAAAEQAQLVALTGHVKRDDPADPGNDDVSSWPAKDRSSLVTICYENLSSSRHAAIQAVEQPSISAGRHLQRSLRRSRRLTTTPGDCHESDRVIVVGNRDSYRRHNIVPLCKYEEAKHAIS